MMSVIKSVSFFFYLSFLSSSFSGAPRASRRGGSRFDEIVKFSGSSSAKFGIRESDSETGEGTSVSFEIFGIPILNV